MKMTEQHVCEKQDQLTLYRIGMFAAMNHVTIKALRYYDEQGLLCPAVIDEENNYRYYLLSQMGQLHQILALKKLGFHIDEIKAIQEGKSEKDLLLRKKNQLLTQMADLAGQLAKVEQALMRGEVKGTSHVLIKQIPRVIVASMRRCIHSYDELFTMMPEMGAEMERLGCECAMPEYCFTLYEEQENQEKEIWIETCEAVTKKQEDTARMTFKEMEEIPEAACLFHKGSYNDLSRSYEVLLQYIEDSGYEICGHIRESYIDGVWNKDSEEEWLTEIQIPVMKRGSMDA